MGNKTCGECRYLLHKDTFEVCTFNFTETHIFDAACEHFSPPTNGDRIRQGNNRELAEIFDDLYSGNKCKYCIHHAGSGVCKLTDQHAEYDEGEFDEDEVCVDGIESWLNAPAESEAKDE